MLGKVTSAIGEAGGDIGAVDIVELRKDVILRDVASIVTRNELHEEYIIPSVFNKEVAPAVAREVIKAAQKSGVARRWRRSSTH